MIRPAPGVAVLLLLLLVPLTGATAADESHRRILDAVRRHLQADYGDEPGLSIRIDPLDRRLRLPRCDTALETFSPGNRRRGARQTVGVRCPASGQGWSLYVSTTISLRKPVLVAARTVPRGSPLTRADVRLETRDVAALHRGYLERPEQLLGQAPKRDLAPGQVIGPGLLGARKVIRRGSRVTILGRIGAIKVRMAGRALGDAAVGERVRVENSSSKRRIEATAVAAGIVEVAL
ncbi:MAG TPA: flagellar basal body P-ring formation protein FlgA [Sedimenticola thiotaurini]|uniref:Flagella basal body P-ring formation protein FlgA n=1 Tax=Sedimenticola thiotaurini TaxID=1543721 RepID=A0A831WAJ1_9GAMM|nr:flagellar basal body P-ring formation protein FlgA [Sedimenticola thiotaurini]